MAELALNMARMVAEPPARPGGAVAADKSDMTHQATSRENPQDAGLPADSNTGNAEIVDFKEMLHKQLAQFANSEGHKQKNPEKTVHDLNETQTSSKQGTEDKTVTKADVLADMSENVLFAVADISVSHFNINTYKKSNKPSSISGTTTLTTCTKANTPSSVSGTTTLTNNQNTPNAAKPTDYKTSETSNQTRESSPPTHDTQVENKQKGTVLQTPAAVEQKELKSEVIESDSFRTNTKTLETMGNQVVSAVEKANQTLTPGVVRDTMPGVDVLKELYGSHKTTGTSSLKAERNTSLQSKTSGQSSALSADVQLPKEKELLTKTVGTDFVQMVGANQTQPSHKADTLISQGIQAETASVPSQSSPSPVEQILTQIPAAVTGTNQQIRISLNPEELGAVKVSFRQQGEQLEGTIEVQNPEVRKEVEKEVAQIAASLAQAGIQIRRIEVTPMQNSSQQQSQNEQYTQSFSSADQHYLAGQANQHDSGGSESRYQGSNKTGSEESLIGGSGGSPGQNQFMIYA